MPTNNNFSRAAQTDNRTVFLRWLESITIDDSYGGRKYWGTEEEVLKRLEKGAPPIPNQYWGDKQDVAQRQEELSRKPEIPHHLIEQRASFLWDLDGRQEGRDEYYWITAERQLRQESVLLTGPLVRGERRLEALLRWFKGLAMFEIFEVIGSVGIAIAAISFIATQDIRHEQDVFTAWQTITSGHQQSGNGGRKEAIEFLVSRPWRFPWLCREQYPACIFRQPPQSLAGLDVGLPNDLVTIRPGTGAYLARLQAPGALLARATFKDADLSNANLYEADLWGANLQGANLLDANLQGAYLRDVNLQRAELRGANLQQAELRLANLQQATLLFADLRQATLLFADLQGATLWNSNLQGAYLWDSNLQQSSLSDADMQQVNLWRANLQEADLSNANLEEATLDSVNLQGANLLDANLQGASLWNTNLKQASLRDANLQESSLRDANLQQADLSGANLQGANLQGANLIGGIYSGNTTGLPPEFVHEMVHIDQFYNEFSEEERCEYIQYARFYGC